VFFGAVAGTGFDGGEQDGPVVDIEFDEYA
jgi:hypothetical protein